MSNQSSKKKKGKNVDKTSRSSPEFIIKLPFGKVNDTSLPDDFEPGALDITVPTQQPPEGTEHLQIRFTELPYFDVEPDDPEDCITTSWIVMGNTKEKVLKHPGFPKHVPKPPFQTPSYAIRSAEGMGLGVFATRDIDIGDLILAERPLLIAPRQVTFTSPKIEAHHTREQMIQMYLYEAERMYGVALSRMTPQRRNAYKALANSHKEDGSGPLVGILRTNVYGIDSQPMCNGPDGTPVSDRNGYAAVADHGSRINHSCVSNVTTHFDVASFSLQFYAKTKIKAGEQLFYTYCGDPVAPVAERQAKLAPYGIVCKCRLCANATPSSDAKLQDLGSRRYVVCWEAAFFLVKPFVKQDKNSAAGIVQVRGMEYLVKSLEDTRKELDMVGQYWFEPLLVFLHALYLRTGRTNKAQELAKTIVRHAALDLLTYNGQTE